MIINTKPHLRGGLIYRIGRVKVAGYYDLHHNLPRANREWFVRNYINQEYKIFHEDEDAAHKHCQELVQKFYDDLTFDGRLIL